MAVVEVFHELAGEGEPVVLLSGTPDSSREAQTWIAFPTSAFC